MQPSVLTYADGSTTLRGELYRPKDANGRGALVIHEADGIGANVRRRCASLADLGYVAFAADMHGDGRVLEGDEMQRAIGSFRVDPERFRGRVGAGLDALCAETRLAPERTVALGYCFGGMAVLELARSGAPVAAVASFHGLLTTAKPATAGSIRTRIAVFNGDSDPLVPRADVQQFEQEMRDAGADWQLSNYGDAWHSFTNIGVRDLGDPRMRYDPIADRLSWNAAIDFLDAALPAPGASGGD